MMPEFYISSSEGHMDGDARSCFVIKRVKCGDRDDCIIVRINPPLKGEQYDIGAFEIHKVVLVARLAGDSLLSPSKWPIPVYVIHAIVNDLEERDYISVDEYKVIAWAEIYDDRAKAPPSYRYTFGE